MTTRTTLQVLAQIGAILSAAVAYVVYRINAGGADPADRCFVIYTILTIFAYEFVFVCVNRCTNDKDGVTCTVHCLLYFIIIQLLLLLALLLCLIVGGPF